MSGATAETVAVAGEPVALRVSGRIARAADHTWRVGVRASGLVQAVFVNLGDTVPKGKVLARYHADEARDERAKYRSAVAELQRLQSAAALAKRNLDRAQSLFELKAVTAKWNCDARIKTSSDRDGNVKWESRETTFEYETERESATVLHASQSHWSVIYAESAALRRRSRRRQAGSVEAIRRSPGATPIRVR